MDILRRIARPASDLLRSRSGPPVYTGLYKHGTALYPTLTLSRMDSYRAWMDITIVFSFAHHKHKFSNLWFGFLCRHFGLFGHRS